ncbi:MAG: glycine--tRNA ligase [Chloroflexi bacterium]|nr:glycine--tRNA ligase [Chloroflexota bacterium]
MVQMETIVSLAKRRGFIFPSSEIYGGIGGFWDFGPLGVELKNNVKRAWWRAVVQLRDDVVGLDSAIVMNPQVWEASGHVAGFTDPMVDCKQCKRRFRADQIEGERCPECSGELTEARQFNLMFKTFVGPVEEAAAQTYLRPETAQGIFVNFAAVQQSMRLKLPFGIAQIGKAFRNEMTPGHFIFRSREFEQMEMEYFVRPGMDEDWHRHWLDVRMGWYRTLGLSQERIRLRQQEPGELAHYAKDTFDIEYLFPQGWAELEGIANRRDFDLRQHSQFSGKDLSYFDEETQQHILPYVIEPSAGADRATLAFLLDAYTEEVVRKEKRVVLKLHRDLAPIKAAILPLLRNRPELVDMARHLAVILRRRFMVMYDDTASIGRLYRRQDEIGTPFCITVDVDSLADQQVTIRDRDSMEQVRIPVAEVPDWLGGKLIPAPFQI